jgi:hypothetical protein
MKIKLLFGILFLLVQVNFLHAQDTIGKDNAVLKPVSYDSTKTFEEQYKAENQYQFIGLQLFLPPVIDPKAGPVVFSKNSNDFTKGNKYYTIIDILQGDVTQQLKQKKVINQCGSRYKNLDSLLLKDMIIFVVFVLHDNDKNDSLNNDSLYWVVCQGKQAPYCASYFNSFIPVPYYEYEKQTFQDQDVIYLSDKSKWLCKEVTLVKSWDNESQDSVYDVFCLLGNDKSEQMQLRPPSDKYGRNFITEQEYTWLDHADRNEKDEMLKAKSEKLEKYKSECINKFGKHSGELVAQGKIEIGMTSEMCKTAWGAPWDISKTTTSSIIKETWFYNWKYKLYFENGSLVKIEN